MRRARARLVSEYDGEWWAWYEARNREPQHAPRVSLRGQSDAIERVQLDGLQATPMSPGRTTTIERHWSDLPWPAGCEGREVCEVLTISDKIR